MDSITSYTLKATKRLLSDEKSIIEFVNYLGEFDEYNFYGRGNEWIEETLKDNYKKYGNLDSIILRGTAHNRSSRYDRTSTEIQFIYNDSSLTYDYINYSGEKYFVPNGTNTFNLLISQTKNKNEFILQDMLKRFGDKVFTFEVLKNNLIISINENEKIELKKTVYNNVNN